MRAAGWINVVVAAIVMLATLPGRTQGLGLITEPMLADLRLDRVTYATINLWATLIGAAICLPIGRVFDTVGLRSTTLALTLLLAAVVWGMSQIGGGAWLAVRARPRHARARPERAVGRQHHRPSASRSAGTPACRWASTRCCSASSSCWRSSRSAAASAPPAGGRRGPRSRSASSCWPRPRCCSCASRRTADGRRRPRRAAGATLGEALRTPAFWIFAVATSLFGLVSSGLGLFNQHVLAERGFPQTIYVTFLAATAIIALVGQFGCGWLTRYWPMPRLLAIAMGIYGAALGALPFVTAHVAALGRRGDARDYRAAWSRCCSSRCGATRSGRRTSGASRAPPRC